MITIVLDGEFPSFNGMVAKTKIHWGAYSSSKRNLTNRVAKEARKYLPELFKLGGTIGKMNLRTTKQYSNFMKSRSNTKK